MQMQPITTEHLRMAFERVALQGWTYDAAMNDPVRRHVIVACAHAIRTSEWERTQHRTVEPVRRIKLGCDGHPVGWCTQMAQGPLAPATQADIFQP